MSILSGCSGSGSGTETEEELRAQANAISATAADRTEKIAAPLRQQASEALADTPKATADNAVKPDSSRSNTTE